MTVRRILVLVILLPPLVALALRVGPSPGMAEKMSMAAPEFPKNARWLQSKPLTTASLRGQVVVLQFWTFG
jgi:hypothetical protein